MRWLFPILALLLAVAPGKGVADQSIMAKFCNAQWGTSTPLATSCVQAQEEAARRVDLLLIKASSLGWRNEVEQQCEFSRKQDNVAALQCLDAAISQREWLGNDLAMARADAWQKPEGVPREIFLNVKAQCINDFGLKYSTVEICIDHSTREYKP